MKCFFVYLQAVWLVSQIHKQQYVCRQFHVVQLHRYMFKLFTFYFKYVTFQSERDILSGFLKGMKTHLIFDVCLLQVCWMCTVSNASSWTIWSSCVLITLTRSCSSTLWLITWKPSRRSMWPRGCSGPSYGTKTTRAAWTWLKAVLPAFSPFSMRSACTYQKSENYLHHKCSDCLYL